MLWQVQASPDWPAACEARAADAEQQARDLQGQLDEQQAAEDQLREQLQQRNKAQWAERLQHKAEKTETQAALRDCQELQHATQEEVGVVRELLQAAEERCLTLEQQTAVAQGVTQSAFGLRPAVLLGILGSRSGCQGVVWTDDYCSDVK